MEQRLMSPPQAVFISATPQFRQCIEACLQCFESCEQVIQSLSSQESVNPELIRLLNDAVEITQVSATFMLRGSSFHIRTSAVCSEVCKVCAEALEREHVGISEELLNSCLTALRECSENCYQMAHHH